MKILIIIYVLLCSISCLAAERIAFVDDELACIFPVKIRNLKFERFEKYKEEENGYLLKYRSSNLLDAEIHIANFNFTTIPDGHTSKEVGSLLDAEYEKIKHLKLKGEARKVYRGASIVLPKKGAVQFTLCPTVHIPTDNEDPISVTIAASGYKGLFICARFKYKKTDAPKVKVDIFTLLGTLSEALTTKYTQNQLTQAHCHTFLQAPSKNSGKWSAKHIMEKARELGLSAYPNLLQFTETDGSENSGLIKIGYFAGLLSAKIDEKTEDESDFAAFKSMLMTYQKLHDDNLIRSIKEYDEWSAVADKKALFENLIGK